MKNLREWDALWVRLEKIPDYDHEAAESLKNSMDEIYRTGLTALQIRVLARIIESAYRIGKEQ